MSDTMLLGCLRMPIELYPEGVSEESASFIVQQQSRCVEAADKIEQLQKENEELRKELVVAVELIEGFNKDVAEFSSAEE